MSKKHHGGPAPVPPGNRPQTGPAFTTPDDQNGLTEDVEAGFSDQDPKRRLGGFTGPGEHARQQPGPLNDGGQQGR